MITHSLQGTFPRPALPRSAANQKRISEPDADPHSSQSAPAHSGGVGPSSNTEGSCPAGCWSGSGQCRYSAIWGRGASAARLVLSPRVGNTSLPLCCSRSFCIAIPPVRRIPFKSSLFPLCRYHLPSVAINPLNSLLSS